ncbi:hypothetical protein Q8A67_015443 [Cirrhinus molitorella]|uniref:Uncharacterized protein n=1 Tax=Cirrhinus molitorella TaxID=172907 RepID=A0AA88PTL2_9TELE|nr:hypothetical protein Q8A67_015443 [Cirrhinus molitorella]
MASEKNLYGENETKTPKCMIQRESPETSCVSMKSDRSIDNPINFSVTDSLDNWRLIQIESSECSCLSMKSDWSIMQPPEFSETVSPANVRNKMDESKSESNFTEKKKLDSIFKNLKHTIISLMKKELKMFKRVLSLDYPSWPEREEEDEGQKKVKIGLLNITLNVLKKMNQTDLANTLQTSKSYESLSL